MNRQLKFAVSLSILLLFAIVYSSLINAQINIKEDSKTLVDGKTLADGVEKEIKTMADIERGTYKVKAEEAEIKVDGNTYSNLKKDSFIMTEDGKVVVAELVVTKQTTLTFGSDVITVPANTRVVYEYGEIQVFGEKGSEINFGKNDKYGLPFPDYTQKITLGAEQKVDFDAETNTFSGMDFNLADIHLTGKIDGKNQVPATLRVVENGYVIGKGSSAFWGSKNLEITSRLDYLFGEEVLLATKKDGLTEQTNYILPEKILEANGKGFSLELKPGNEWAEMNEEQKLKFNFFGFEKTKMLLDSRKEEDFRNTLELLDERKKVSPAPRLSVLLNEKSQLSMQNGISDYIWDGRMWKKSTADLSEKIQSVVVKYYNYGVGVNRNAGVPLEITLKESPDSNSKELSFFSSGMGDIVNKKSVVNGKDYDLYMDSQGLLLGPVGSGLANLDQEATDNYYLDEDAKKEILKGMGLSVTQYYGENKEEQQKQFASIMRFKNIMSGLRNNPELQKSFLQSTNINIKLPEYDQDLIPHVWRNAASKENFASFLDKIVTKDGTYGNKPIASIKSKMLEGYDLLHNFEEEFPDALRDYPETQKLAFITGGLKNNLYYEKKIGIKQDVKELIDYYEAVRGDNNKLFTTKDKFHLYGYRGEDKWFEQYEGALVKKFDSPVVRNVEKEGILLEDQILLDIEREEGIFVFNNHGSYWRQNMGTVEIRPGSEEVSGNVRISHPPLVMEITIEADKIAKALFNKHLAGKDLRKTKIICDSCHSADFRESVRWEFNKLLLKKGEDTRSVFFPDFITASSEGRVAYSGMLSEMARHLDDGDFTMEEFFKVQEARKTHRPSLFLDDNQF